MTTALGCGEPRGTSAFDGVAGPGDTTTAGESDSQTNAVAEDGTGATDTASSGSAVDDDGAKFDVPSGSVGGPGCDKVDFLFLVDNSMSMADEQDRLVASFPGFIDTIQNTLAGQDYHVMVVATDPSNLGSGVVECSPAPECCQDACGSITVNGKPPLCNGDPCVSVPADCDNALGAGNTRAIDGSSCALDGSGRYLSNQDVEMAASFACIARTGTEGHGYERQLDTVEAALSSVINEPDGCNEGFLRDDAVLVLTILTDEDDGDSDELVQSVGDPQDWYDAVVAAKLGDPQDVVVLALIGDGDVADGVCGPDMDVEPAPRLRSFVERFGDHGRWASICHDDFTPFFADAVALVDATCDAFEPEG